MSLTVTGGILIWIGMAIASFLISLALISCCLQSVR